MRALSLIAASLGAAAFLAGCGGGGGGTSTGTTTHPFDPVADITYERSYTDCGSVAIRDLATRYKVKATKDAVALGVAKYWAARAGGGQTAVEAGKEGCYDGYKAAGR